MQPMVGRHFPKLQRLPRLALAAYAARCARRVQPLIARFWQDAPRKHLSVIDRAIGFAEHSDVARLKDIKKNLRSARIAASKATLGSTNDAADYACYAAYAACRVASDCPRGAAVQYASDAIFAANRASSAGSVESQADLELLLKSADAEGWTDETPVRPDFFGPLWPFGKPDGWPDDDVRSDGPRTLRLTLDLPRDVDDETIVAAVAALAAEADGLHRAYGGNGLTIEDLRIEQPAPVAAGGQL